jgi:hypothetical protein
MKSLSVAKALACVSALCDSDPVAAQERCKISWEVLPANNNYTQQHVLDIDDIAGHQIRIFEVHRTFPDDRPNCEGLRRIEQWDRAFSDYVDRNGLVRGYSVTMLENGDKIFGEYSGTSQTSTNPDGTKQSTFTGTTRYTGGTGRYASVRGIMRDTAVFDPSRNFLQLKSDGEYWFEK